MSVEFINAKELSEWLLTGPVDQLAILDVRDDDYHGGHITSAAHCPSSTFNLRLAEFAEMYGDKELVVVHCMLSQVRGPECAIKLSNAMKEKRARVVVLTDGFQGWLASFRGDSRLISEYDASYWG